MTTTTLAPPQTPPAQAPSQPLASGIAREKDPISGLPAPINALPGYAIGFAIGLLGVLATVLLV